MNVSFGLPQKTLERCWATIGSFDGVHRGHQKVIARVLKAAFKNGVASAAFTFDPHPRCVLAPDTCPLTLTTVDEKAEILAELGVEHLIVLPFTHKLSQLTATEFMDRLVRRVPLAGITVGYDFAFGHQRRGNREFLQNYGARAGFAVDVVPPYSRQGHIVSSSAIRALLLDGRVEPAARLLGREYSISAFVERGTQTGSRIGFPTANLAITPNKLVPHTGVHAVWVDIDGKTFMGALDIGYRPTFGGNRLMVEVYILDFKRDIYRQPIRARFVRRIREDRFFPSVEALVKQIERDVERTRTILSR